MKAVKRRVIENFSWSALGEAGGKGMYFLVSIYLARKLKVENYGVFMFAQTLVSYFWLGADLGVNMYGQRELCRNRKNVSGVINPLHTLRLVSAVFMLIVVLLWTVIFVNGETEKTTIIGCSIYLISRAISTEWIYRGFEKFAEVAISNLAIFGCMILLMLFLVKTTQDLVKAAYIWSLSYLIGSLGLLLVMKLRNGITYRPNFRLSVWIIHLKESLHFTASGGIAALYFNIPIIYLGMFSSKWETGIFTAAFKVVYSLSFILSIVSMSVYPVLSDLYVRDRARFERYKKLYVKVSLGIGLGISLLVTTWSETIVLILYGKEYSNSGKVLQYLIWFVALCSPRVAYNTIMAAAGMQRWYSWASIMSAGVICFCLYIFLKITQTPTSAAVLSLLISEGSFLVIVQLISMRCLEAPRRLETEKA